MLKASTTLFIKYFARVKSSLDRELELSTTKTKSIASFPWQPENIMNKSVISCICILIKALQTFQSRNTMNNFSTMIAFFKICFKNYLDQAVLPGLWNCVLQMIETSFHMYLLGPLPSKPLYYVAWYTVRQQCPSRGVSEVPTSWRSPNWFRTCFWLCSSHFATLMLFGFLGTYLGLPK